MNLSQPPLHIPDGFLSLTISILFWGISMTVIFIAIKRSQNALNQKQIPLMGIMAAFIFAAQMINFPVAGGTSGHLLGGALAAIILGPWSGILVMTSVISLQALLFQDGGLVVMGANIFNMGILTTLTGYGLYATVINRKKNLQLGVIAVAALLSVIASALSTSVQIWISGLSPARLIFPAMLSIHSLIGIGEALITVAAFSFIQQVRPDLIGQQFSPKLSNFGWVFIGVLITFSIVLLSPFASTNPDGLEKVATELGFIDFARKNPFTIFSDYVIPTLENTRISTIVAGVIGIGAVSTVTYFAGKILKKSTPDNSTS